MDFKARVSLQVKLFSMTHFLSMWASNKCNANHCRVRQLLRRASRDFEQYCLYNLRLDDCMPRYVNMPWTEIITACIEYKAGHLDTTDVGGDQVLVYTLLHG